MGVTMESCENRKKVLGSFFFLVTLAVSTFSQAKGLPSFIHFKSVPLKPRYNHSLTTPQIESLWFHHFHSPMMHNPGLTMAEQELKTSYQFQAMQRGHVGPYRIWASSVDVIFQYDKMDVYLSSKYPVGSCQYNVILGHENQHVAINQRTLAKYKTLMLRALQAAKNIPTKAHPQQVYNLEQGKTLISSRIDQLLLPLYDRFKREVEAENGKIDTMANYRRTQALCHGW